MAESFMSDKLDGFFLEYFDVVGVPTAFKDTVEATSAYDGSTDSHLSSSRLNKSYRNLVVRGHGDEPEMLDFFTDTVARVVVQDTDVLRTLLTTREFYVPSTEFPEGNGNTTANMQRVFGIDIDLPPTRAGRWYTLPNTERAGLLTHPAWLAAHGDAFEDGPSAVLRGKWVREHLFCESVPPLELVNVEAQLVPTDGTLTARDRIEQSIEVHSECMTCHQSMNSLGYPFEVYNHAGFLRAEDHGASPDGSTVVTNAPDSALNQSFDNAIDFTEALADSEHVKRCFIRHTFRYFAGRDETPEDACLLTEMETAYDTSGGSFISMLETFLRDRPEGYRWSGPRAGWEKTVNKTGHRSRCCAPLR